MRVMSLWAGLIGHQRAFPVSLSRRPCDIVQRLRVGQKPSTMNTELERKGHHAELLAIILALAESLRMLFQISRCITRRPGVCIFLFKGEPRDAFLCL